MEVGQVTEAGERAEKMSAPHDVPIRQSAPPYSSTGAFEGPHQSPYASNAKDVPRPSSSDVWAGAISRLQAQVQLNTSMLEQNRQKFLELENVIQILHTEVHGMKNAIHDVQIELRGRPTSVESRRHDPRDLEVLTQQVETVTNKANEVDGLRMQLNLLQNTMKRLEEHGSPAVTGLRPGTSSTHREVAFHDTAHHPPSAISHHLSNAPFHQPLPPMRTASMSSAADSRPTSLHGSHPGPHGHVFDPPSSSGYHASPYANDASTTAHPLSATSFRPPEPLPPPSSLTGWRPADSMVPPGNLPAPPQSSGSVRPPSMEPSAGWAAVNTAQTSKRPYEEQRPSPYESPRSGSPKRPKLAPIMPRSNYGDESSYVPLSIPSTTESAFASRSRAPSDTSQSQNLLTPSSGNTSGHRFIISTQDADSQASRRPESDRLLHAHHHGHTGRGPHGYGQGHGRGRGRGLRGGRGRRGRGGAIGGGVTLGNTQSHPPDPQELGTPEWEEKPDWTGSQVSPNGFYNPMHHRSPETGPRGSVVSASGASIGPLDRESEFPATPLAVQGPYDPFAVGHLDSSAMGQISGGKKTRTKPIRNSEGVLIRKDGRPDMRSVSSANNLRKVHAKKEAERAEMDGRTPNSARSLAPAGSNEMSENGSGSPGSLAEADDGDEEEQNTQERHSELMRKIFPPGAEPTGPSVAERFFPRTEPDTSEERTMEQRSEEPDANHVRERENEHNSQMTEVVMREMGEAQANDHADTANQQEDMKMETVDEANEKQETEKEP